MRRVLSKWMFAPCISQSAATSRRIGSSIVTSNNNILLPSEGLALYVTVRYLSAAAANSDASMKKVRRGRKMTAVEQQVNAEVPTKGKQRRRSNKNPKTKSAKGIVQEEKEKVGKTGMIGAEDDEDMDCATEAIWEHEEQRMREADDCDDEEERGASGGDGDGDTPTGGGEETPPSLDGEGRFLRDRFPDLAEEYDTTANDIPLDEVTVDSAHVAAWRCGDCGFKWRSGVFVRTCLRTKCPHCEMVRNPPLGGRFVQLWDHALNDPCVDPRTVTASSNKPAFWHCPTCSTSYQARIKDMVTGKAKCPSCSLLNLHADFSKDENGLLQEWHPLKNGDLQPSQVKPTDRIKLWWLCMACGHEWEATLAARLAQSRRVKGKECPVCHGKGKDG